MRYHDLKIRDASRLAIIATGLIVIVIGCVAFRQNVEPLINMLPARSREPFMPIMSALVILALLCSWMAIHYLRTSPAQNAEYISRMAAKGRVPRGKFNLSLLDPADPNYDVSTWNYLLQKRKSRD